MILSFCPSINSSLELDENVGKSKYEGGINDAVLVQEYADGEEYAVDTVV